MQKRKKSIFSRLVKSYIVFLFATLFLYLLVAVLLLMFQGNGDLDNLSPQSLVGSDGTITDPKVLDRIGAWVEELDAEGNVIRVQGKKTNDKYSYSLAELATLLDLGNVRYGSNGVMLEKFEPGQADEIAASIRCVDDPRRIFIVCYPRDTVTYLVSYNINSSESNRLNVFLIVFGILFATEVVAISLYLKKHIEKPLRFLMDGMDEVSEGKRDVVLDFRTDAEFEKIRDKFNSMAERLRKSEEEKQRIQQSRNQMLLELSHDIKNPVASIKGSVSALEAGLVSEDKIESYYKAIDSKAERIRMLTEDMHTSLKLESDDYKINLDRRDVCEIVRRNCAEFYEDITALDKVFDIDIPDEPIMALLDENLFSRVVVNLLSNAMKYDKSGNYIGVRIYKDTQVVVEVMDDGEEIRADFVPHLFEAFARGDAARKTDGGTGLGLAIARKIVERHGGSLTYIRAEEKNCFCIRVKEVV
ncbi:MAG: HAMP domain-containing histidine kinase [Lachnospiraceae bacterium]|nr:HAMP domain-containing histidine kinase [Lachnospiraceae bacterium]